jgi:FkbM family methyltransferase
VGADSDPYRAARFLVDSYPALSNPPLTIADGNPRRPLAFCEFRVRSQNGEDGVIAEMVSRIGTGSRTFVEFGIENGSEGNCIFLADWCHWRGLFIEADPEMFIRLRSKYESTGTVQTLHSRVTPDNINELLRGAALPYDLDVMSIDIDGDDYWVWSAITQMAPRVVVIEYNASFRRHEHLVQPRDHGEWDRTNAFGASIGALEDLGRTLGYHLVHTELAGVNAFFVRTDLLSLFPEANDPLIHGPNYFLGSHGHPEGTHDQFTVTSPSEVTSNESPEAPLDDDSLRGIQRVMDNELGYLLFPRGDNVMAPTIAATGVWEPQELKWLKERVHQGDTCLNIGANVGYFASWMSRLVGPTGRVIAIEPNPEILPLLRANLASCAFANVDVVECAAGTQEGTLTLWLNEENFGDSRVFDPRLTDGGGDYRSHGFADSPRSVEVPVKRIDDVVGERKIDVVLVDTQGWDHHALRGLSRTIARCKPFILTEFVPSWISDLGENPESVLNDYVSWGYLIDSTDHQLSAPVAPHDIIEAVEASADYFTNISLTPLPPTTPD